MPDYPSNISRAQFALIQPVKSARKICTRTVALITRENRCKQFAISVYREVAIPFRVNTKL